jgi:2-oxoisovalerate dehydrogenase E1 component
MFVLDESSFENTQLESHVDSFIARFTENNEALSKQFSWYRVIWHVLLSRAIDNLEKSKLFPEKKIPMQFSAGGHELSQTILAEYVKHPFDGISVYYRNRPLMLGLGFSITQALAGPLAASQSITSGRDGGMVFHRVGLGVQPTVMPMCGDVGSQYTQCVGWAQALRYRQEVLGRSECQNAIAVVLGGDGSIATGGFWSALNIATTLKLPVLFYIEDNGYAISVNSTLQTPGGDIASNLSSYENLMIYNGDGTDPKWLSENINLAVTSVRNGYGPVLMRVKVPRLSGHSIQDSQNYKNKNQIAKDEEHDPYHKLKAYVLNKTISEDVWGIFENQAHDLVEQAYLDLQQSITSDHQNIYKYKYFSPHNELQSQGGITPEGQPTMMRLVAVTKNVQRMSLALAINKTLEIEMRQNERMLIFGQDVGLKGGVHGVTANLQKEFGAQRVCDTSLSEEGIVGRAVGLALCGLLPCPEIQFRKYADAAMEQIRNVGTMRWRTFNKFAAPMVLRMAVGATGTEDHWHNLCDESIFAHMVGWKIVFPSNASDAVGLLRTALRGNDPVIFLEHRALLNSSNARRDYPGDSFALPIGEANIVKEGSDLTIISWGAMLEKCLTAAANSRYSLEIIDLRTVVPWDQEKICKSVNKTGRCLIVHEDNLTCGIGAEISAVLCEKEMFSLHAPILRVAVPDIPIPYRCSLMEEVLPSVVTISSKIEEVMSY